MKPLAVLRKTAYLCNLIALKEGNEYEYNNAR